MMQGYFVRLFSLMLGVFALFGLGSCGGGGDNPEEGQGSIAWSTGENVSWEASSQFIKITAPAGMNWTATVDAAWCSFADNAQSISGTGTRNVSLHYDRNTTTQSRTATVMVAFLHANSATLRLVQGPFEAAGSNTATLSRTQVGWNDTENPVTVTVRSSLSWTLSTTDAWLWFGTSDDPVASVSGSGNAQQTLYFASNGSDAARTGYVTVTFAGQEPFRLALTQTANGQAPPDPVRPGKWVELPLMPEEPDWLYVSHVLSLNGASRRNYSLCYDTEYGVAYWVAYPLHKLYIGSTGRTDAWNYDPTIPPRYQPNLAHGMGNGYDRGHQIPSGDRTVNREYNRQTFYYSNMTAQVGRGFNQSVWANLEGKIRNDYMCPDTLYVVTGCVLTTESSPTVKWASNSNGGQIVVPAAYFKVLLRTKTGNSGAPVTDENAMCIGFWFENRTYSSSQPSRANTKSVAEIEQLTGFTFFPTLSAPVKQQFDPARWGL